MCHLAPGANKRQLIEGSRSGTASVPIGEALQESPDPELERAPCSEIRRKVRGPVPQFLSAAADPADLAG
jgi:hypothetical protein